MEIVLTILVVLAALVAFKGIKTVPQGECWTVERFGAYTRLLQPGLSFIVPFVEGIGRRVNIQEVVLDIPEQSVITGDNVSVLVDGIVYYRVLEPAKAAYAVQSMQNALTSLAMTNIRAVIGEMELDATLSGRERINSQLLKTLDGATEPWGVKVSRVEIKKVEPPESLSRAMAMQMTAERERRAAVVRAEGEKMATVLEAEGEREAAFRQAEARERMAEAEAKATRMVAEAAQGGSAALNYFIAQKYVEAVQALAAAPGKTTLVVPLETAGFAGGIAQALEAMRLPGPSDGPPPPAPPPAPRSVPSAGSPFAPPGPR